MPDGSTPPRPLRDIHTDPKKPAGLVRTDEAGSLPSPYHAPMPELPEVETTRRGIAPHVTGRTVARVVVRESRLRWPVPPALVRQLPGMTITGVARRGKYLLFEFPAGTAVAHLGMSGSLRLIDAGAPPATHDHVDIVFTHGQALRLRDPRRFGSLLWTTRPWQEHRLLRDLGPEPLGDAFDGGYLFAAARGRRGAVKHFIMDSHVVVGIGNIYANEALFLAGIHPRRAAGRISRERYDRLATAIRRVLNEAISAGGTTLRDFTNGVGEPGYFGVHLRVYGRGGEACPRCGEPVREIRQGQRTSFYCPVCQR
jgi:formamidopyrimidine-DNA glycosylase